MINFKYLTNVIGKKERSFLMGWKLSEKKMIWNKKSCWCFTKSMLK